MYSRGEETARTPAAQRQDPPVARLLWDEDPGLVAVLIGRRTTAERFEALEPVHWGCDLQLARSRATERLGAILEV